MADLVQFLRELLASGQLGVIVVALVVAVGGGVWVIWLQRQTMTRLDTVMKAVELNMKAADTARSEGKIVQEQVQLGLQKQFEFVVNTNEELRKELERVKDNQDRIETDVKKYLSAGLLELKSSLRQITIREIVGEIPESFRKDIEQEVKLATEQALMRITEAIKNSTSFSFSTDILSESIKKSFYTAADDNRFRSDLQSFFRHNIEKLLREIFDQRMLFWPENQAELNYLADKIADRVIYQINRRLK